MQIGMLGGLTVWRSVITVFLLALSLEAVADPPEGYPFMAYDEGLSVAGESGKRVFLYFGRYGCGFCDKTNKESFSDKDVARRYKDHYVLVYADAESGRRLTLPSGETITEQQLGARLKTLVTPYFLFLEPDGSLIMKAPGFKTVKDLLAFDAYVDGGHYKSMSLAQFARSETE
jgi:thioredoxin-related protein